MSRPPDANGPMTELIDGSLLHETADDEPCLPLPLPLLLFSGMSSEPLLSFGWKQCPIRVVSCFNRLSPSAQYQPFRRDEGFKPAHWNIPYHNR